MNSNLWRDEEGPQYPLVLVCEWQEAGAVLAQGHEVDAHLPRQQGSLSRVQGVIWGNGRGPCHVYREGYMGPWQGSMPCVQGGIYGALAGVDRSLHRVHRSLHVWERY